MKKKYFLIISLCIIVAGCGAEQEDIVVETSNSLKICVLDNEKTAFLDYPMRKFQEKYPEVDIQVELLSFDNLGEEQEKSATKLMAGEGADLYINPGNLFPDVYKVQESGMLEDLMPWFEKMNNFAKNDYLTGTFDLYEKTEACYIFPTGVFPRTIALWKDMVDRLDINIEQWDNASDIYEAIEKYYQNYPEGSPFLKSRPYSQWLSGHGFNIGEGLKNAQILDSPELRRDMMLYKKQAYPEGVSIQTGEANDYEMEQMYRREGAYLGHIIYNDIEEFLLMGGDSYAYLVPEYDDAGNIRVSTLGQVAVSANSTNKENAVKFIQIIMEEESNMGWGTGTVNKENNKKYLSQLYDQWVQNKILINGEIYDGLTKEDYEVLESVYLRGTVTVEPPVYTKYQEIMESFFLNESSYDACIEEFRDYLEIYYSE